MTLVNWAADRFSRLRTSSPLTPCSGSPERPRRPYCSRTAGEGGSSPDNGGTCWQYQTARARLARSDGVTKVNQWLKLRKR